MTNHTNGYQTDYLLDCLQMLRTYRDTNHDQTTQTVLNEAVHALTTALQELQEAYEKTEAARNLYEDLFDSCPDGYVVTNRQGKIVNMSTHATDLLGRAKEDVVGHGFDQYIVDEDRARFHEQQRRVAQGKVVKDWNIHLSLPCQQS